MTDLVPKAKLAVDLGRKLISTEDMLNQSNARVAQLFNELAKVKQVANDLVAENQQLRDVVGKVIDGGKPTMDEVRSVTETINNPAPSIPETFCVMAFTASMLDQWGVSIAASRTLYPVDQQETVLQIADGLRADAITLRNNLEVKES